jgi:hypothetical protein
VALGALALSSCGGSGDSASSPLDAALGYLPADAPVVAAVSTDLESDSLKDLDVALQRFGVQGGLDGQLEGIASYAGVSFANDVQPLLGNDLVIGLPPAPAAEESTPQPILALSTTDGGRAEDLVSSLPDLEQRDDIDGASVYGPPVPEGLPEGVDPEQLAGQGPAVAIDGDVVVAAQSTTALQAALDERDASDRLTQTEFESRVAGLPNGLLRVAGDARSVLRTLGLDQAESVPWVGAMRTFGLGADVRGRNLSVEARLDTDDVAEEDLPLTASPGAAPRLLRDRPSGANADQSQTASFALAVLRASLPAATFDDITHRVEEGFGGNVGSLVDQFGQGAIAELPNGDTVTVSELKDPGAVADALDSLKDEVARLANAAGTAGPVADALARARFLLPALPLTTSTFPAGARVEPVPGTGALYRIAATPPGGVELQSEDPFSPGYAPLLSASDFVFGVLDGRFVTAPSLDSARQAVDAGTFAAPKSGYAFSIPVRASDFGLSPTTGPGTGITLTTVEGQISAATDGLHLSAHAGL